MKKILAWAACLLVLAVAGVVAFEELRSRYVIVERRGPSLLAHLPFSYVANGTREISCALSIEEHPSFKTFLKLLIDCRSSTTTTRKSYDVSYSEDINERLVSLIRLFDGAEHVVTVWIRENVEFVRVYRVTTDGITKVLETEPVTIRGVRYDRDGNLMIETQVHGADGGDNSPATVIRVWDPTTGQFREQR